jgi:hypothetical protein
VSRTDSLLFATSFAAALEQAQDDYEQVVVEQEQLEDTVNTLFQSVVRLEESNLKKDEYLGKQQRAIEEAKKQILKLKNQVGTIKKEQLRRHPSPARELVAPSRTSPARRELVAPSRTAAAAEQIHRYKSDNIKEMRSKSAMRGLM